MGGKWVVGVSGGPDSMYLLHELLPFRDKIVVAHFNHGARGAASERDMKLVEDSGRRLGIEVRAGRARSLSGAAAARGFEGKARDARRAFLSRTRADCGASGILLAHTADDRVETVLMRIFEGAGISGLKGIPRRTHDGIERPLLDTWRSDILEYLRCQKIAYRTDKSNFDTRFERNWIRHVLIPLLEKRYGKAVRKRIFTLGERFREIDEFLGAAAGRWLKRNARHVSGAAVPAWRFARARYAKLAPAVRKRIVQQLCFEVDVAPNERLIESADKVIVSGKPSARLNLGHGAAVVCRYGDAEFRAGGGDDGAGAADGGPGSLVVREIEGRPTPAELRRLAVGALAAAFDARAIRGPLDVRPLRTGDRIRPFGLTGEKKVKEVLIDRKVPRGERWGRPVVCDADGVIVWIPGVVRSSAAPVTPATRRTLVLRISHGAALTIGCSPGRRVLR